MPDAAEITEIMHTVDALQEQVDAVFNRVNADPVFHTKAAIEDAISDHVRYFDADRKADLAEIFFAVLEQIYARLVHPEDPNPFCNPQADAGPDSHARFPQFDMLLRDVMPLSWALGAKWDPPELKGSICPYFQSFTEEEAGAVNDVLRFLCRVFPELADRPGCADVLEFWETMTHDKASLPVEDDVAKSKLLDVLLRKKNALDASKKTPLR